jgi:hypothetical protein
VTQPSAFAAAAAQMSQQAAPSAPVSNPLPFNEADLFAKPSDFKGGAFTPTPPMEALIGRTCVYIPRTFDAAAKDPFDPTGQKTRKQWTVDLYVIDGGELRFWYQKKGDQNATPPTQPATVEMVFPECSPATPYVSLHQWVSQAAIVSKLTAASEKRQILIGSPIMGAQKAQLDQGATDASVREQYAQWVANGKPGKEPKFLWLLSDVTAEGMARVQEWYGLHKDSLKL